MALPPDQMTVRLISSKFTLAPGTETYQCERLTIPDDMYIVRITPVSPVGVHHEVLAIDTTGAADGTTSCNAGAVAATKNLYASGINSPALQMPDKVALKIDAGNKILLNLHLFNASTTTAIDATAAIDVVLAKDPTGYALAGVPFVGNITFTVPASLQVNGKCKMSNDTKFFAVFPHMHQTGEHIKIWTTDSTTNMDTVVWDNPYSFEDQKFGFYPNWMGPQEIALKAGDYIKVTCSYSPAGQGISFGDSTTKEMCFAISYVTPPINTLGAFCTN